MKVVVADTSALNYLALIGSRLWLLEFYLFL